MIDYDSISTIEESTKALSLLLPDRKVPELLVILGSGFKGFDSILTEQIEIPFHKILNFPLPKVEGHGASLVVGKMDGKLTGIFTGRVHLYEGHSPAKAVFPIRVMAKLGVKKIIMTNASGSVDRAISPGSLVLIEDHINLTGENALIGSLGRILGPQFPDMSQVYCKSWRDLVLSRNSALKKGVYAGVLGPTYETPSETKMLGLIGANIVGMSTVQEAIAAHHMGIKVLGLSFVTNMAGGLGEALSHHDVIALVDKNQDHLRQVLRNIILDS